MKLTMFTKLPKNNWMSLEANSQPNKLKILRRPLKNWANGKTKILKQVMSMQLKTPSLEPEMPQ